MARKKTDAPLTDAEQAEEILAQAGYAEVPTVEADGTKPKTQMQEMVEALATPAPKMPEHMPAEDKIVYVWAQPTPFGDVNFEPAPDVTKKRSAIQIPEDAVFLSTRSGPRVKLANGKLLDAKEVAGMASRSIGGFVALGAPISHRAGQIG